jgi:serine/threonine-protein kinase
MAAMNAGFAALALPDRQVVESWLFAFDRGWHDSRLAEAVRALPPPGSPLRFAALVEMVKIDLERQWQQGRPVCLEDYLRAYPELGTGDTAPADLIAKEYEVRQQSGAVPQLTAFLHRFPGRAEQLRPLLEHARENGTDSGHGAKATPPSGPGRATVIDPAGSPDFPTRIGRYMIRKRLGQGGMGSVYLARDTELDRDVAVKVIRPEGWELLSPQERQGVSARFVAEAQAAARLEHEHIVKVYEVGEADGRPFYAMRYVDGQSLHDLLRVGPLNARRAAGYLEQVGRAVHEAHQHGILHRDLKPHNILVDARNDRALVADFGLAKQLPAADGQIHGDPTRTGEVMGSPPYMSPEQAQSSARVTVASEVYSLGATLYALLTGRPPFQAETAVLTLHQVLHEEPAPPRQLQPSIPRDLETICLKCLHKEPAKRYASAEALANDLRRFLNGEPISARPVGRVERLCRWVRGNPGLAAAGLVAITAVLALALGSLWHIKQDARRATAEALRSARDQHRRDLAVQAVQLALDQAGEAREALQQRLRRPGGVFELLSRPESWEAHITIAQARLRNAQDRMADLGAGAAAELADRATALQALLGQDEKDRHIAGRLEAIRMSRAALVNGKFDLRNAAADYPKAFAAAGLAVREETAQTTAARIAVSPIKEQLVAALDDWAWVAFRLGRADLCARVLAVARQAAPDPQWGDRLRRISLWRDPRALIDLAKTMPAAGMSPHLLGVVGNLLPEGSAFAESWWRQAQGRCPDDFWLNLGLGTALRKAKPVEAEAYYRAALAVRPGSAVIYCNLGVVLHEQKRLPEAVAAFRRAIDLDRRYALPYYNLGNGLFQDEKDLNGAVRQYRRALELDPDFAAAHYNLGVALRAKGDQDGARHHFEKAIALDPDDALAHNNLGNILRETGDVDAAILHLRKAIQLDPNFAQAHFNLGLVLQQKNDLDGAIRQCETAVALDPTDAEAHWNLGQYYVAQGEFEKALPILQRGSELLAKQESWRAVPSKLWVKRCEQLLALDQKGKAILDGKVRCRDSHELIAVARLCEDPKRHFATAADFYARAFAANAAAADDLAAQWRYRAASCAIRAAAGQGRDAGKLDEEGKARLRQLALAWLRADLARYAKQRQEGNAERARRAVQRLSGWHQDGDLASIRDAKELAKLPETERRAWERLWTEVRQLTMPSAPAPREPGGGNGARDQAEEPTKPPMMAALPALGRRDRRIIECDCYVRPSLARGPS